MWVEAVGGVRCGAPVRLDGVAAEAAGARSEGESMRAIRTPATPEAVKVSLVAMEAKVRSLRAQLVAARKERDALRVEAERLRAALDDGAWRQD